MRLINKLLPVFALLIFAVAIYFVHHLLKQHTYREIAGYMKSIPLERRLLAVALTAISYTVLSSYDFMAFRYIGRPLAPLKIAFGSFTAFAFSNNIGLANLAGSSIRLRVYSTYGVDPQDTLKIIAFNTVTFWMGFFALAGVTLTISPLQFPPTWSVPQESVRIVGIILFLIAAAYLALGIFRKKPIKIRNWVFELPSFSLSFLQILVAAGDWALAGIVLYVLLPADSGVSFSQFLTIFVSAQVVALLAHVPGGVGVLEALVIYFVTPDHQPSASVLGALLAYRLIYYIIPLITAATLLVVYEGYRKRHLVSVVGKGAGNLTGLFIPHAASIMTFMAGAAMLISGVTPGERSRLTSLVAWLPLGAIEASHFLASCVGAALLIVAQALLKRSHAAWLVTLFLLILGTVLSLARGFDYEVALLMLFFTGLLYMSRTQFHRRAALTTERLTPTWIAAMTMVILGTIWIGLFAHRHFEYTNSLWWKFALSGGAPRFLRASFGGMFTCIALSLFYLLRPLRESSSLVHVSPLEIAELIGSTSSALSYLAFSTKLKCVTNPERDSYLIYAETASIWISIGGGFGNPEAIEDLIIDFHDAAKAKGRKIRFIYATPEDLSFLVDLGLEFTVMGEDPIVSLDTVGAINNPTSSLFFDVLEPASRHNFEFSRLEPIAGFKDGQGVGLKIGDHVGVVFPIAIASSAGEVRSAAVLYGNPDEKTLSADFFVLPSPSREADENFLILSLIRWARAGGYEFLNLGPRLVSTSSVVSGLASKSILRFSAHPGELSSPDTASIILS